MSENNRIADAVEAAEVLDSGGYEERGEGPEPDTRLAYSDHDYRHEDHHDDDAPVNEGGPSHDDDEGIDWDAVAECARLDHSDTDNATRLIRHFGEDLTVLAQDSVAGGDWLGWAGTHWDHAGGAARVRLITQKLGGRIALEARLLGPTPEEQRVINDGLEAEPDSVERKEAEKVKASVAKRRQARRAFAVTSKNSGRMEKALECAAPRLRRMPEAFNRDKLMVACASHTLQFVRELDDPGGETARRRYYARVEALPGHRREDWLTAIVPVPWAGLEAEAPRWRAFMDWALPDAAKRRTVQQVAGVGLLGMSLQYVMFHYGLGANGKSVFLETLTRVLGPGLAVGLPRESIVGASERSAGGASPDLVRLYGKRMVRILEVKGDAPLQEDLIKRLTGGEAFPVRTLFKGYFEFQSFATPHMSGNGFPTVDGTDNGIWRRLLVVHWDQVVPPESRRDMEEMVSEFVDEEGPGVLAWLVEGALDFLENGLAVAPSIQTTTDDYREEMDPIGEFRSSCVRKADGQRVQSRAMYQAYRSWSLANAKRPRSETKFGRTMKQHITTQEIGGRIYYLDCDLHDVPERPTTSDDPGPQPDW